MHVIETVRDLSLAETAGLDIFATETCEDCFEAVGELESGVFKQFVVLLDDESEWIICAQCANPVL